MAHWLPVPLGVGATPGSVLAMWATNGVSEKPSSWSLRGEASKSGTNSPTWSR